MEMDRLNMEELEFLASFQRRSVLGDISPSSLYWRGSPSHVNVSYLHELCPSPSPEEQIIRQRSRRHSEIIKRQPFEAIENDTTFLQITPAKDSKFTQLSRKRLLLSSPTRSTSTPIKESVCKPPKRPRLSLDSNVPLQSELHAFSTSQLVEVLDKLVNNHPELEQELRSSLPSPDIGPLEEKLAELKRNIFRSLPTVRFGSSRDAYCYRRAKGHINEFKKTCIEQGKLLVLAQSWDSVVRYTVCAWKYINQLPKWDDPSHNSIRHQCFEALASQSMVALKRGHFEKEKYRSIRKKLEKSSAYSKAIEPCVQQIDKILGEML